MQNLKQANLPIMEIDGKMVTPDEMMAKPMSLSALSDVESFITPNLLVTRILQKYNEGALYPVSFISFGTYDAEQQLEEIEKQTDIGKHLLDMERGMIVEMSSWLQM